MSVTPHPYCAEQCGPVNGLTLLLNHQDGLRYLKGNEA